MLLRVDTDVSGRLKKKQQTNKNRKKRKLKRIAQVLSSKCPVVGGQPVSCW